MKRLTIIRDETGDEGTFSIGMLTQGENRLGWWDFIECPWRDNKEGISCIPPGTYRARVIDSPHFHRKVYLLQDVPDRDAIEIHVANWAGDVELGYHSNLKGCLAPGTGRDEIVPPGGEMKQKAVVSSGVALNALIAATDGEEIEVVIAWEEGVGP